MRPARIAVIALLGMIVILTAGCILDENSDNSIDQHTNLDGTYYTSTLPYLLIFDGDTVTLDFGGDNTPHTYEYSIPGGIENGTTIILNISSLNTTTSYNFGYHGCCIQFGSLTACKSGSGNKNNGVAETTYINAGLFSNELTVELTPLNGAKAGVVYTAYLFENGVFRSYCSFEWSQPAINVGDPKYVTFPITSEESTAYWDCDPYIDCDLRDIFSVYVHD